MEPKGIEPSTSALRTRKSSILTDAGKELTATPSAACTLACTANTENRNETTLDALAAALLGLSPDDRAKLAALLVGQGDKVKG